jgi:hypothetical protein
LLPGNVTFSDDDNEPKYGTTALSKLKALKAMHTAVVIARWYGGEQCGKVRFEHIKAAIDEALEQAGHVPGTDIREAVWRNSGEGNTTMGEDAKGGQSAEKLSVEELRMKRLEKLGGGMASSSPKKKESRKAEVIDLTQSSDDDGTSVPSPTPSPPTKRTKTGHDHRDQSDTRAEEEASPSSC